MNRLTKTIGILFAVIAGAVFVWSYWPMLVALGALWNREDDYSHIILVPVISCVMLWWRADKLAGVPIGPSWIGLLLIGISYLVRYAGLLYYFDPFEHLSSVLWVAGVVWALGGARLLLWALPPIAFLLFSFPIPYRMEDMLGVPLQRLATATSCWLMQAFGYPAFSIGTTITVNHVKIEVVEACSGIRMLVSFLALCVAFSIFSTRSWWERILVVLASVPIALACNFFRITATGIVLQYTDMKWVKDLLHDGAGFAMMPLALGMLFTLLWFLDRLFVETEVVESTLRVRHPRGA